MILSKENLDALRVGFETRFQTAYDGVEPIHSRLATEVPSSTGSTVFGWIAQQVKARKWAGPRVAQNLEEREYLVVNEDFEATIEVPRNQVEDDNLGLYSNLSDQLGVAMRKAPDEVLIDALQGTVVAFDGQPLFSATHPTYDGSTVYSNSFTSNPLTAPNFATARAAMAAYVGEDGKPLGIRGTLLIVPPQLERIAREIVESTIMVGAGGSNVTTSNVMNGWAQVLVIPELADEPGTWYLADVNRGVLPFVYVNRKSPEFAAKDSITDDNVFEFNAFRYGSHSRFAIAPTLPFLISKSVAT